MKLWKEYMSPTQFVCMSPHTYNLSVLSLLYLFCTASSSCTLLHSLGLKLQATSKMEITNVSEYEAIAKEKLPKMAYDYYASGAEDQWTLAENRNAFSRILFRPRILIDVSHIDVTTTVLGFKISMPIMIAPTAFQKMAHPEGMLLFTLPPFLTLKNFEGLDLGKMDKAADSGLASYVAGQIDRSLSWKIGRPVVFSLAAEGEAGIKKVLQMLREEFELTMALSGCRSLKEITRNHVVTDWDVPRPRHHPRL
ncbi:unnamed protein product [Malus baccata var. baccata]